MSRRWAEDEMLVALGLYCKLPFGQFHSKQPMIIRAAEGLNRTPSSVAMKLSNLASLDPVITDSGRSGLKSASELDRRMWAHFRADPERWMPKIEAKLNELLPNGAQLERSDGDRTEPEPNYAADSRTITAQQRSGQALFRDAVLSAYQGRCCLTGISDTRLLVASHIRPWRLDRCNRLNPRNGLCLSALVDRAFDQGLITFTDDFRLKVSLTLEALRNNPHAREAFFEREGQAIDLPEKFVPETELVRWHRQHHFVDNCPQRSRALD